MYPARRTDRIYDPTGLAMVTAFNRVPKFFNPNSSEVAAGMSDQCAPKLNPIITEPMYTAPGKARAMMVCPIANAMRATMMNFGLGVPNW